MTRGESQIRGVAVIAALAPIGALGETSLQTCFERTGEPADLGCLSDGEIQTELLALLRAEHLEARVAVVLANEASAAGIRSALHGLAADAAHAVAVLLHHAARLGVRPAGAPLAPALADIARSCEIVMRRDAMHRRVWLVCRAQRLIVRKLRWLRSKVDDDALQTVLGDLARMHEGRIDGIQKMFAIKQDRRQQR